MKILISILIFGALIFVHELGHFICARLFGVKVNEFAVGMGPKLISRTSPKSGIAYSLRLLPIGGFVSMAGEDEQSDDENALNRKPCWQRLIIMFAGAFMNILIGVILMSAIVASSDALGSNVVHSFRENAVSVDYGIEVGDEIRAVDGVRTHTSYEVTYQIMRRGTEPIPVTVQRNGEIITLDNVSFPISVDSGASFGALDFYVRAEDKNPLTVIKHAYYQSKTSIVMIIESLFDMVTGRYGMDQVSGPVGTTASIGEAAKQGGSSLAYISAIIAINLGVVNLLPLPALDGGRIVFVLIEMIRRKPIDPKYEGYVHLAGIVLLMALMVLITFHDIVKLFG